MSRSRTRTEKPSSARPAAPPASSVSAEAAAHHVPGACVRFLERVQPTGHDVGQVESHRPGDADLHLTTACWPKRAPPRRALRRDGHSPHTRRLPGPAAGASLAGPAAVWRRDAGDHRPYTRAHAGPLQASHPPTGTVRCPPRGCLGTDGVLAHPPCGRTPLTRPWWSFRRPAEVGGHLTNGRRARETSPHGSLPGPGRRAAQAQRGCTGGGRWLLIIGQGVATLAGVQVVRWRASGRRAASSQPVSRATC